MSDKEAQASAILNAVSAIKDVSPLFMGLITGALVIWAIFRAHSAHFLLDKIWRIVGGGVTHDEDLKKAWLRVRDLEGFRFRTGIKFSTKDTFTRTLTWLEHNDKNLNDLSFARAWIAGKPWEITPPRLRPIQIFAFTVFLITAPLIMGMFAAFTETSALLTIRDSGTTFWTDGVTARNFALVRPKVDFKVDLATCVSGSFKELDEADREVVCSSLDPNKLSFVQETIKVQKAYSLSIAILCILTMAIAARYAARAKMATVLSKLQVPSIT